MISVQVHVDALEERVDSINRLIEVTHPSEESSDGFMGVQREARGLSILLLFASYENLLRSLTRTLLEGAARCRVSNGRLQPGFRLFALESRAKSLRDISTKKLYTQDGIIAFINSVESGERPATINTNAFPDDGSFFRRSQLELWCQIFRVENASSLLGETWQRLDAIVRDRNKIAHGEVTPDDVGRRYTQPEISNVIADWSTDWVCFLREIEQLASTRDYFRVPR